jgi:hypothetical protein
MPITIDHHDIIKALELFRLEVTDYYLEFTNEVIYMHWVACPKDIEDYLDEDNVCLDLQVKGKWLTLSQYKKDYIERPFTNCRYILATN